MLFKEIKWQKYNSMDQVASVALPDGNWLQLWKRTKGKFDVYLDREELDPHDTNDPPDPLQRWEQLDVLQLMCLIHVYLNEEEEDGTKG
jgi:hypothetical protein